MKRKIIGLILIACVLIVGCFTSSACQEKPPVSPVVVQIGSQTQNYDTLNEAIVQSAQNDIIKIKLNQNLTLTEWFNVNLNEYEIDLNGHNISVADNFSKIAAIVVGENAKLTIKGNGTINSASQGNDYSIAVWAKNGGEVVIEGGTFTNVGAKSFEDNGITPNNNELIYASTNSTITINGGTFIGNYENSIHGTKYTLNKLDADASVISVTGGEFRQYDPSNSASENPTKNFVAQGYKVTTSQRDGATWYTVSAE